jgi:hypothetical protein
MSGRRPAWGALVRILRPRREECVPSFCPDIRDRKECPCAALVRSHLFVRVPERRPNGSA